MFLLHNFYDSDLTKSQEMVPMCWFTMLHDDVRYLNLFSKHSHWVYNACKITNKKQHSQN
jgi:hypothetical protein